MWISFVFKTKPTYFGWSEIPTEETTRARGSLVLGLGTILDFRGKERRKDGDQRGGRG
jgi:hypothetical protein